MKPPLLVLAHRIPYPPDRGEKIRCFHVLRHLAPSYELHLGCLVDDPADMPHVDALRRLCASVGAFPIDKRRQRWSALARIKRGQPLMLDYYRHPGLHAWTDQVLARLPAARTYVYTVAMMPYLRGRRTGVVLDAVDVDSEKWTSYAQTARLPMRLIWAREGRTMLAYERHAALAAEATLFVSAAERDRFATLAPDTAPRLHAIENGVDLAYFSPAHTFDSPFQAPGPHLVMTGNMDYWPNEDAATWFATQVLPAIRERQPGTCFHIVGAHPGPRLRQLARQPGVFVTGRVPDVRPYLAHADLCVCPLRIARGIQNKVLEAMAMARPVLASPEAFEGVHATPGRDLLVAEGPTATADAALSVLDGRHPGLGARGRTAVQAHYEWDDTLRGLDPILAAARPIDAHAFVPQQADLCPGSAG